MTSSLQIIPSDKKISSRFQHDSLLHLHKARQNNTALYQRYNFPTLLSISHDKFRPKDYMVNFNFHTYFSSVIIVFFNIICPGFTTKKRVQLFIHTKKNQQKIIRIFQEA